MADEVGVGAVMEGGEDRQCYICLDAAQVEDYRWVSPCRCTGTMAWVHKECVLRWVRELERHAAVPTCAQCLTPFVLTPEKGPLLLALDMFYKRVIPVCKYLAGCTISVIAFDSACASMGILALSQVYGVDETITTVLAYKDPFEAVAFLHLISYSLLFFSYLPWEDCLLRIMQRSSNIPLLKAVLPSNVHGHFHEFPMRRNSISSIISNAMLLPIIANILGTLFFSKIETRLSRVLIGGVVYSALKCGFYMYLRQKLMLRQQLIRVLPVEEHADT